MRPPGATEVLHHDMAAQALDSETGHGAERNRTVSPGSSKAGRSRPGSNSATLVRPTSCHPPGISIGYTPQYSPARPTAPAGTRTRGSSRRGTRGSSSVGTQYAKPGAKPQNATTKVAAWCRSATACGLQDQASATTSRSAPSYVVSSTVSRPRELATAGESGIGSA